MKWPIRVNRISAHIHSSLQGEFLRDQGFDLLRHGRSLRWHMGEIVGSLKKTRTKRKMAREYLLGFWVEAAHIAYSWLMDVHIHTYAWIAYTYWYIHTYIHTYIRSIGFRTWYLTWLTLGAHLTMCWTVALHFLSHSYLA
mgnify:CR=1 FL=1